MKNYCLAIAITLLLALVLVSSVAHAGSKMLMGSSSSEITDRGGCNFWRPKFKEPKLVKEFFDDGKNAHINYERQSGNPILLEGSRYKGDKQQRVAALNLDGKELLLEYAKSESIKCIDRTRNKKVPCDSSEYAGKDLRVKIVQLTNQSVCFPFSEGCVGSSVSALITLTNATSKLSLVVVGHCGG
jgi:hypothetical protein